ncbi:MAG: hypothetical protein EOO65_03010, partial [Methanosarcinales archaeon]
ESLFVRSHFSAPNDATWMSATGSTACPSPGHVFALLKGSDKVQHDLDLFDQLCHHCAAHGLPTPTFQLALLPHYSLARSNEFRVFVVNGRLAAISQRHATEHYPFLQDMKEHFRDVIAAAFHRATLAHLPLPTCTSTHKYPRRAHAVHTPCTHARVVAAAAEASCRGS